MVFRWSLDKTSLHQRCWYDLSYSTRFQKFCLPQTRFSVPSIFLGPDEKTIIIEFLTDLGKKFGNLLHYNRVKSKVKIIVKISRFPKPPNSPDFDSTDQSHIVDSLLFVDGDFHPSEESIQSQNEVDLPNLLPKKCDFFQQNGAISHHSAPMKKYLN
jgi:hypothetical protein